MILPITYFPRHEENRMNSEGNVELARKRFFEEKPNNLWFLLSERFSWMNRFLSGLDSIVELGSGAGFSKTFITNNNFKTSDVVNRQWIDLKIDALDLQFENDSVDAVVCSHMIHHIASPVRFFNGVSRVLKPGGLIVISDIYTSWLMKLMLRVMRHEGWSYDVKIFSPDSIANDPDDPWSANCAIPELLFKNTEDFEKAFPEFEVIYKKLTECLIFPLSGGVIAKTRTVNLPFFILKFVNLIDSILIYCFPQVFALGIRVVVRKR